MKYMISLLLASICGMVTGEDSPMPQSAQTAMDRLAKTKEKAMQEYEKAMFDARAKAISELQKSMESETKKGNLEGAVAIKKSLQELSELNRDRNDLLGSAKGSSDPLVGKWGSAKWGDSKVNLIWDLKENGTGEHYWGTSVYPVTWKKEGNAYLVTVSGGVRNLVMFGNDAINIEPGIFVRMKKKPDE